MKAFKSNFLVLNVTNSAVANPLGSPPAQADRKQATANMDSVEGEVRACATKASERASRVSFCVTIDAPSGEVIAACGLYGSARSYSCAKPVYQGARFPKVQQREYALTVTISL